MERGICPRALSKSMGGGVNTKAMFSDNSDLGFVSPEVPVDALGMNLSLFSTSKTL